MSSRPKPCALLRAPSTPLAIAQAVQNAAMSAAKDPAVQKAAVNAVKDNPGLAVSQHYLPFLLSALPFAFCLETFASRAPSLKRSELRGSG